MDKYIKVKEKLAALGCFAIIVPSNDPHFGEYVQPYYGVRSWYSNFTGSAGTLVITQNSDALWTDSRYFIQAAQQMKDSGVELMKIKISGTPSIPNWINSQANNYTSTAANNSTADTSTKVKVAIDKSLFSYGEYLSLVKEIEPCVVVLVDDIFNDVWSDRPKLLFNEIKLLPLEYAGESTESKYRRVVDTLGVASPFIYPIAACDEIAWLCNIRGTDIDYNPVAMSYAAVTHSGIELFVKLDCVGEELKSELQKNGVTLHSYDSFESYLLNVPSSWLRFYSPSKITVRDYFALNAPGAVFIEDSVVGGTVNYLKSIKNSVELNGFREAFKLDGVAWCNLLEFLDSSFKSGKVLNEYEVGEKLIEFRKESALYRGESFTPIVAFGKAGALPHYHTDAESSQNIGTGSFLLMDTGAQYLCGTTDTTRTIPIGELSQKQIKAYTLVLKGMIDLSMAKFPAGTRGSQLDILARGPLFNEGWMFFHGTSHGIGHYLCVHEGPQNVRMEENSVALAPAMVISNEPAIYFSDEFGIRTENVIAVKEWKQSEFNNFYEFETFTLVPICSSCIDKNLLTAKELEWLSWFNSRVYKEIAPLLEPKVAEWLYNATLL